MWVNPEDHKIIGGVLAKFRLQAGLKQQDLATRLGKPQSFISAYESGQRRIDILELLRITESMNVDPLQVFSEIRYQRKHGGMSLQT